MATLAHKGGSKVDMTNYRPLFNSPIICSKILEKVMLTRLFDFLDKNNVIYKHQFDFQKNKLTSQAVFDLFTRIVDVFDKGNCACSVL